MGGSPVFLLPGWQNSGEAHWQSRWEVLHGFERLEQHDWMRPLRGDWISRLEDVLLGQSRAAVLVAHSLGCLLVAAWAGHSRNTHLVKGALLVAPPDLDAVDTPPALWSWRPAPKQPLPFKTILLASHNDPFGSFGHAQRLAHQWGSTLVDCGQHGHINAESGLGDWPDGLAMVQSLTDPTPHEQ
jgi:predicted alpha/beta hydrolase family esterase